MLKLFLHGNHLLGHHHFLLLPMLLLKNVLKLLLAQRQIIHDLFQIVLTSKVHAQHLVLLTLALQDEATDVDVGSRLVEL